jgi:hypothetical protein
MKRKIINDSMITVKLPFKLWRLAKEKSKKTGIPISFIVRLELLKWVGKECQENKNHKS